MTLCLHDGSIGHFAADDVVSRVRSLNENMESLQARAARRQKDLEANVQFQQYLADLHEAEAWIREKEPIVDNTNYGADEEAAGVRSFSYCEWEGSAQVLGHCLGFSMMTFWPSSAGKPYELT